MAQEGKSKRLPRRDVLKGAAIGAAGAAAGMVSSSASAAGSGPMLPGACLCPYPGVPEKWDASYDVVVVGAGAAGLMAAIEAADAGATVVMLESQPERSGSSPLSGGIFVLCETDLEPGTGDELYEDLLAAHQNDHDEALNRAYVSAAPAVYRRLVDSGVKFTMAMAWAYMSKKWGHQSSSAVETCDALEATATGLGAELVVNTRAMRLITGPGKRVIGVEADQAGETKYFKANRAVVLASGDFSRNKEMAKNYGAPGSEKIFPLTGPACLGDGLRMGMTVGADTAYLCVGVAPSLPAEIETKTTITVFMNGGIALGLDGKRFFNEQYSYVDMTKRSLQMPDPQGRIAQVYDDAIRQSAIASLEKAVEYKADTIEELAQILADEHGMNAEAMVETIKNYNTYVEQGHDPEFGREHLTGITGDLVKIETPPFYAVITIPGTSHFNGGLKITPDMRVIDMYGEVIPGLFAAGGVTGGFHGAGYMSGTGLGMAAVFGHIAGINAAAEAPWE